MINAKKNHPLPLKLLKIAIIYIATIYSKITEKQNGASFCFLYNFRTFLTNSSTRISQDKTGHHYIAKGDGYTRSFLAKRQNIMTYSNGISNRGRSLGNAYSLDLVKFESGDTIIDCGANIGDLEIYFKESAIHPKYFAIEPSPTDFKYLNKNLLFESSKAFNNALYDKQGVLDFYVSSEFGDSSLIKPSKFTDIVKIETITLDEFVSRNSINKIKLLKLEAEGAEPEILMGARNCLSQIEYIAADLGFERGVKADSTLPDVANFLIQRGFEIVDFRAPRITCLFKNTRLPH